MSQLKIKDNNDNWIDIPASGIGVPSGGTTGQVLQKSSNTDYATEWAEPQEVYLLEGTLPSSTGQEITHAFPSGCDSTNSVVLAIEISYSNIWRGLTYMAVIPAEYAVLTSVRSDGVHMYVSGSRAPSCPYRCYLLRFA